MTELAIEDAERIAGRRLDRRRKYFLWDGEVCFNASAVTPCSGCSCDSEYPCTCCTERGEGCSECGYTGRQVQHFPLPHMAAAHPTDSGQGGGA